MTRRWTSFAGAVGLSAMLVVMAVGPAAAAGDKGPVGLPPLPDTMTVEEMNAIPTGGDIEFTFPDGDADTGVSTRGVPMGVSGSRCYLDPGDMWVRASGRGYRYGAIGSKPRIHGCTLDVRKTGMSSDVWQFNGWFWFRASGSFASYGTGNMQQKSVQHICTGTGRYLYKVITTAWGTNGKGYTGVGRDATAETPFACG